MESAGLGEMDAGRHGTTDLLWHVPVLRGADLTETPTDIWKDDRFNRRAEAENLIGYIESVGSRPRVREDHAGHVLAVDGGYGRGKTFFLKRLQRHLAINHPVAYVDAWLDDLQDEPLVAIASTLQEALTPYLDEKVRERLATFTRKAGRVSRIVATGLLKRGLGLLITQGAVELLGDEIAISGDDLQAELNKQAVEDASKGLTDDIVGKEQKVDSSKKLPSIQERIATFREGRRAVQEMRDSLSAVVSAIAETESYPPIIIIVDELDRCKPTYALKLLEEIKHLFDVEGIVFVLGMHEVQLAHSVSGAYGGNFDGPAYLRRFIDRKYILEEPSLKNLISLLVEDMRIDIDRLEAPNITMKNRGAGQRHPSEVILFYCEAYYLSARDVIKFLEALQICLAIVKVGELFAPYLFPLIIHEVLGIDPLAPKKSYDWHFWVPASAPQGYGQDKDYRAVDADVMFKEIDDVVRQPVDVIKNVSYNEMSYAQAIASINYDNRAPKNFSSLFGYNRLIHTVTKFSDEAAA